MTFAMETDLTFAFEYIIYRFRFLLNSDGHLTAIFLHIDHNVMKIPF